MDHLLLLLLLSCGCVIFIYTINKCRLWYFLLSAAAGFAALTAADLIGGFFELNLPLNVLSVSLSVLGGLPGVILLNILSAVFR